MTTTAELTSLLTDGDFAGVEHVARESIRRGDPGPATDALWTWMFAAWSERPLPRLAELLSLLGSHRTLTACGEKLVSQTQKNIPDDDWYTTLREREDRNVDAVLQTLTRTRNREVADRLEAFQKNHLHKRDPRIATVFLDWLEAPPFRATSMQPVWLVVFDFLFEQGDPRCVPAFDRLVEREFPAGATMKKWMAAAFQRERERWAARDDIETLRHLATAEAERTLGDLDALAAVVAALTGEFVEAGGELATLDLEKVLAPGGLFAGEPVPSAFAAGATVHRTHALGSEWARQVVTDSGRVAARQGADLVVFEADGRVVWAGTGCSAFDLSTDGRFLAQAIGTRVRLIDLQNQSEVETELVDLALHEVFINGYDSRQSVCFDPDGDTVYVCCVAVAPRYSNYEPATTVVAMQFDVSPLRFVAIEPQFEADAATNPEFARVLSHRGAMTASRDWVVLAVPTQSRRNEDILVFRRVEAGKLSFHKAFTPSDAGGVPAMSWDADQRLVISTRWYGKPQVTVAVDLATGCSEALELSPQVMHPYQKLWVPLLSAARNRDALLVGTDGLGSPRLSLYLRNEAPISISLKDPPASLALSPDGQWLVAAIARTIFRYDVVALTKKGKKGKKGKKPKPTKLKGHKARVTQLLIAAEGQQVVSLASDAIMVWSPGGDCVHDLRHASAPLFMALHPGGQLLASCDAGRGYVWDLALGQEAAVVELTSVPAAVAWSVDQTSVCVAAPSDSGVWEVVQWSPASNAVTTLWQSDSPIVSLVSLPGTRHLVAGTQAGSVFLLQTTADGSATTSAQLLSRHVAAPVAMDFDHAGNLIVGAGVFGGSGSVVCLAPAGKAGPGIESPRPVTSVQISDLKPVAFPTHRKGDSLRTAVVAAEAARATVLANPPTTGVKDKIRKQILKRLGNIKKHEQALAQLLEVGDDGLWQQIVAQIDPAAPILGEDLLGIQREGPTLSRMLGRAPSVDIVEAYRNLIRTVVQQRGEDISGLQLPAVERLELSEPVGWADLTGMPALQDLHIRIYQGWEKLHKSLITARYPSGLHRLTLNVRNTSRTPSLVDTPFTHVTLVGAVNTACAGLDTVQTLAFSFNEKRTSLDDLAVCQRLESLSMMRPRSLTDIGGLAGAVQAGSPLRSVSIEECTALQSLDGLQDAKALETLEITEAPLEDLSPLANLRRLRKLTLEGLTKLSDFEALATLQLETLSLAGCTRFVDLGVLERSKPTLRTLELVGCTGVRDVSVLDGFPALESVALGGTMVRPEDLSPWLLERAHWFERPVELNIVESAKQSIEPRTHP